MSSVRRNAYYDVPNGVLFYRTDDDRYNIAFANKGVDVEALALELGVQIDPGMSKPPRLAKRFKPAFAEGKMYYLDADGEYQMYVEGQAALQQALVTAEADQVDMEKLIMLGSAIAINEMSLWNLNMADPATPGEDTLGVLNVAGEPQDNLINAFRYYRENNALFLIKNSPGLPIINLDFDYKLNPLWTKDAMFNTDDYKKLTGEEAFGDISKGNKNFRMFKALKGDEFEGEPAYQDDRGDDVKPHLNGSMLFYPDEESFKSGETGGDLVTPAFCMFPSYERLMTLGVDEASEFERGKVATAFLCEFLSYSPSGDSIIEAAAKPGQTTFELKIIDILASKYRNFALLLSGMVDILKILDLPLAEPIQVDKDTAYYLEQSDEKTFGSACGNCRFYQEDETCLKVEGDIAKEAYCSNYEMTPAFLFDKIEDLVYAPRSNSDEMVAVVENIFTAMNNPEIYVLRNGWQATTMADGNIYGTTAQLYSALKEAEAQRLPVYKGLESEFKSRKQSITNGPLKNLIKHIEEICNREDINEKRLEIMEVFGKDEDAKRKTGFTRNTGEKVRVKAKDSGVRNMADNVDNENTRPGASKRPMRPGANAKLAKTKDRFGKLIEMRNDADGKGRKPLEIALKGYDETEGMQKIESGMNKVETDIPMDGTEFAKCGSLQRNEVFLLHGERVKKAFEIFTEAIKFKDMETAKVIFASMLIKNGAIILKGVAGTGKTTMIECLSMLMCNPVDYIESAELHPDGMWSSGNTLDAMKNNIFGTVGIAKHNPDKMPDDIYYYSRITQDEYEKEQYEKWLAGPGSEMEMRRNSKSKKTRKNPYAKAFIEDDQNAIAIPMKSRETVFDPVPRQIVTHPIKFHNEGNRMNKKVADATLGLLAEKEIEFLGQTFPSPKTGDGSFTLLDYNPHKDWEPNGEMDRALLDRFDCSVFVPALELGNKIDLMGSGSSMEPRKRVQTAINAYVASSAGKGNPGEGIDPLTYDELYEVWADVNQVQLSAKQRFFAACYTNTFSVQFAKYPAGPDSTFYPDVKKLPIDTTVLEGAAGSKLLGVPDGEEASENAKAYAMMPFMDASVENFGFGTDMPGQDTKDFFSDAMGDTLAINAPLFATIFGAHWSDENHPDGTIARLNQNYRPLGYRNTDSLVRLSKAYTWLEACLESDWDAGAEGMTVSTETMKQLLPFVIGHRLNIGIGDGIKQHFVNVEDWVRNDVVKKYIGRRESHWSELYDGVYETMFGYEIGGKAEEGLAQKAVKKGRGGISAISKKKFLKTYEEVMTRGSRNKSGYYQSLMADPISAQIVDFSFKMAQDICLFDSVWDEEDKAFDLSGPWSRYDADGKERPIFKVDEE